MTPDQLPSPICQLGYPQDQLEELFDEQELRRLGLWMNGQTMAICEARRYNHDTKKYEPNGCDRAHGGVIYAWDLERWLRAGPIID